VTENTGENQDNDNGGDFTDDGTLQAVPAAKTDPPHPETTRRLALLMLARLIGGVVVLAFAMVMFPVPGCHWDSAREFLEITFVPLIALLSGVLGYYANH
jgi:hypothetical protein